MRFRSPSNPLPQMVLVASEATWISLCLAALANSTPNFAMDIPYLLIAIPAVLAVIPGRLARELAWPAPARYGLLLVSGLLLTALGAGALGARTVHGVFSAVAFHPFTVTGRVPSAVSTIAWFSVLAVVARGAWLGAVRSSFRQMGRSAAWALLLFLTLFLFLATEKAHTLHAATRGAAPLFVVFFVEIVVLGRLMREREAAAVGAKGAAGAERRAWSAILIVPVVVVLGLGLGVAAAIGAAGSGVATAARDTGGGIWLGLKAIGAGVVFVLVHLVAGVASAIGWFVRLFYRHPVSRGPLRQHATTTTAANHVHAPNVPPVVGLGVAAAFIIGLILLFRLRPRAERPPRVATPIEELSSTFTWRYLFALTFRAWRRLVARLVTRLRRRSRANSAALQLTPARATYLRVLTAAHAAGRGRARSETPREFAERLAAELGGLAALLEQLTFEYERARYAGDVEAGATANREEAIETLVLAFAELPPLLAAGQQAGIN